MSKKFFVATSVVCALAVLLSGQRPPHAPARPIASGGNQGLLRNAALEQHVRSALGSAGLRFEENVGQADPAVKFFARGSNFALFLTPDEAALRIHTPHVREKRPVQLAPEGRGWADAMAASSLVRMKFAGAKSASRLSGLDAQEGTVNYFIGNDPQNWKRNIPHFGRVRYEQIYPGVDALFYGNRTQMEFDFVVAPGADPSAIRLRLEGAASLELTAQGGLEARAPAGVVTLLPPKLYQQRDGANHEVAGRYVWRGPDEIGFEVAAYDPSRALVIDPATGVLQLGAHPHNNGSPPPSSPPPTGGSVALSTQLGGTFDDSIQAIAIGATSGHVYVTGWTDSNDFPTAGSPFQNGFNGGLFNSSCSIPSFPCGDAFVAEFDISTITAPKLVSSTYFGGAGDEAAWGIALDGTDNVYLVGETDSGNFPVTALTAFDASLPIGGCSTDGQLRACRHVFFSQFDPTLATLKYSTFLAGTDDDEGYGIAVNATGQAFVTGVAGPNFPIVNNLGQTPFQSVYFGAGDVFVAEFDPTLSGAASLLYSTYLGGDGTDVGFAIAVDASNNAYIGGVTFSTNGATNFPTTAGFGSSTNDLVACGSGGLFACGDGFVTVINSTGSALNYSAFLGGNFADQVNAIALDGANNVYATGQTQSGNFQPVSLFTATGTALQPNISGGYDAFVVKFPPNPAVTTIDYATYLGGTNDDFGNAIAIDANGDAFITGSTQSGFDFGFPLVNALQTQTNSGPGIPTSFVSVLDPLGQKLLFSTYYGGLADFFGNKPNDFGNAIALDSTGRIYLAGRTTSYANTTNTSSPNGATGLCLVNQVPNAHPNSFFNDNNGFLVIINPTNTPAACFQPSLAGAFLYSPTVIGHTSGSQGPLIFNQGSADLTSTTSFTGANPADFPITSACPTVTAGGNSCRLLIAFAPTTTTPESATLVLTNNSAGSPFMINLQGQGLPLATVTLTPNPLAYPNTIINQPSISPTLVATFTNTSAASPVNVQTAALSGTNPSDFSISSDGCTGVQLPGGVNATCTISVIFLPNATGPLSATLTVMHDGAGGTSSINLTGNGIQAPPISTIPPLSLTFAPQGQGTMSTAQIVTITNSAAAGSANLAVNQPLTFTGTNAGDFAAAGCAAAVAPGATCNISVTFTPTGTGARAATLQITSNAANSPQTVGVSGTGLAAPTATPSGTVTFPAQVVNTTSAAMNVTLSNAGGSPLGITGVALATGNAGDFAIFSNGCGTSLAAGSNCIVSLTFTPTAIGARTTQLQFTDNAAGSPQSVTINGTGATGPNAALGPATLTFPTPQQINTTSASMPATLTNSGGAALSITSIVASGDFAVLSTNCGLSLAANSNCAINVTFTPSAAGGRNGTLTVMDAVGTQMINITGTGVTPPAVSLSTNNVVFGTQAVGVTTAPMPVTLTNTGGSQLNINAIAPSGDFAETDNCLPSVAAGGMCTIMVTFTPSGVGMRNGSILFVDNAAGSPQTITLSGTGSSNVPGFNIAAPLFFGAVLVGSTSPAQTVTITNSGGAPLTITSAMASAQFNAANGCAAPVGIGQNCTIMVSFTPTATGTQNGTLTIVDNAPGSPHTVSLSGIGATINIAPPSGGTTTLAVLPGDTAMYPLDVSGTQGLVVTLNLSCVSAAPNTRCSVSPNMVTLGGPAPPSVVVTVLTNCNPALVPPAGGARPILPAPFAGLWVGTLVLFVMLRRVMPRTWLARAAPALLLMLLVVTWAGCVNNPPPAIPGAPTTPAGTYAVTVSANGLNVTKQLMLTLRVI